MRWPRRGGRPIDLFFKRVMFPIRDRRGRLISFGGRTLGRRAAEIRQRAGDGAVLQAPHPVRHRPGAEGRPSRRAADRGRGLHGRDRRAARAGLGGAVAPLGTALTGEQLEALWRLSPKPVLCFDGDAAGARAAARAAELALPLLSPERTLCLAGLPGGQIRTA